MRALVLASRKLINTSIGWRSGNEKREAVDKGRIAVYVRWNNSIVHPRDWPHWRCELEGINQDAHDNLWSTKKLDIKFTIANWKEEECARTHLIKTVSSTHTPTWASKEGHPWESTSVEYCGNCEHHSQMRINSGNVRWCHRLREGLKPPLRLEFSSIRAPCWSVDITLGHSTLNDGSFRDVYFRHFWAIDTNDWVHEWEDSIIDGASKRNTPVR